MDEYSFGAWIRRRRKGLDLTQQELARKINCSLSTIVKIESDQRRPSQQIAALLAEHLSIPKNQWELFVRVARGLKPIDQVSPVPIHLDPLFQKTAGKATCKLPAPPTPLVGRKHELTEVMRLVTLPECRLLTVTGPGGVGKTRLALQIAHDLMVIDPSSFPDGVCFVPLASIMRKENLPKAIAGAIGFNLSGPLSPEDQLLNYLQRKSLLLLLDNAEHLLDGAEVFIRILEHAPGVKLLVTSRECLNVRSEYIFDLHGLSYPPIDADVDLEEYSAVKLFLNRAQQAQTNFFLKREDRPVIAQICRMLDGNPLGIELAVAWVRTLPLSEIATEISRDLDFLMTSARDIPERHRSLRVVFDHSWNLLSPDEQRILRQLSVFRDGFTREAAQEVCEAHLPTLNSLIDKSLLRRSEQGRYDLHELIRGYAAAWLAEEPEEESSTQERHSRFFLSLVCDVGMDLQSNRQKEALTMLSSEIANIRSAWAWAVSHGQLEILRKAAWSLWYFFDLRNYYREAEAVFADAAEMVQRSFKSPPAKIRAANRERYTGALGQFLMHQAYFTMRLGKVGEADALCRTSISSLRAADDPEALAHAYTYYAVLNWTIGKLDLAWSLLQESLPLSQKHGSSWQNTLFTGISGNVAYERGEYELSYQLLCEALERSQVIGDPRLTSFISAYLGRTAFKLNRTAEIEEVLLEGAQITQESGDRFGYGLMLEQLALAAQARKDFTSSEQLFEACVDLFRGIGDAWSLARALTSWGNFERSLGGLTQAAEHFRQAIRLSLEAQALLIALNALVGLAEVYAQEDKAESALEIAFFVMDHFASPQDARDNATLIQLDVEPRLTPDKVEAAYHRARSVTIEEIANDQRSSSWIVP